MPLPVKKSPAAARAAAPEARAPPPPAAGAGEEPSDDEEDLSAGESGPEDSGGDAPAAPPPKARPAPAAKGAAAAKKPAAPKRGPGRPPSKPPAPVLEQKGVVAAPLDPQNRLEFAYQDPAIFKALFTYFKNIKAREIHLRCTPRALTFFARDHGRISRVVAVVAGEHVNWHYCEDEFWLWISREAVEKMFASVDKSFYKITILQRVHDPLNLIFVFKDPDLDKECNYRVALSSYTPDPELYEAEASLTPEALSTEFAVAFTLGAKQFKKSVGDAANYSDELTFEKHGERPLQLTYARGGVHYHEVYRSPEKIQEYSAVLPGELFRATVKVANVKSLAASMVTEEVRILAREEGDIVFRSAIDAKALVVSTLVRPT